MSSMRRQFAGLLVSRGLGSGLQALALILLARSVPPSAFGLVNAVIGVIGFVLVVTGLGLSLYVPLARGAGKQDHVAAGLRLNTWSNLLTALVLVPALVVWSGVNHLHAGVVLIGLSLALERNIDTVLGVPVADGNTHISAISVLLRRVVTLAVMVPAVLAGGDAVWAYTVGLLAGALVAQVHVRLVVRVEGDASAVPPRTLLRLAWPFLASNVAGQARTLDSAVVTATAGPATAGIYASAAKLVQPLLLIPQTLAGVILPRATRLTPAAARRLCGRLAVVSALSMLLVVPVAFVSEDVVVLVMGPEYASAGPALTWSLAGLPFIVLAATLGAVLQAQGRQRLVAVNGLVFAVVGLAGVAVGAVLGGATGAAVGLAVGSALRAVVLGWSAWRLA